MDMIQAAFSYRSWSENERGSNIIDFVHQNLGKRIPIQKVDNFFKEYGINYPSLPQYLKDEIDKLDVY